MATYKGQFDAWRDGHYVAGELDGAGDWHNSPTWALPSFEQTVAAIHANLAISEAIGA